MRAHLRRRGIATKRQIRGVLSSRYLAPLWLPLSRERVTIFTLHRFAMPDMGVDGHDPTLLPKTLERLRKEGYTILSLEDALHRLRERTGFPPCSIVFTVDDGYFDFVPQAPVFAAFDAPVTVFVTTGFLDGTYWHWWDQIEYVIRLTRAEVVTVPRDGTTVTLHLGDQASRQQIAMRVSVDSTTLTESARGEFIKALADAADVEIPARPTDSFAPMTWADARRLENHGVSFGPHTISHPILIRTTDADAEWQIGESWKLLRERVARPMPVLAYPNGDYSSREVELVARAGLAAAVTSEPRYASTASFHARHGNFMIPRFPYPDAPDHVCLTATGFMRVSNAVRRAFPFMR